MKLKIPYQDKISFGYSLARTAHFAVQQFSLPFFEFLATGQTTTRKNIELKEVRKVYSELFKLLKKDSENISKGLYPLEVLKPEKAREHFLRFPKIILDGYKISKRRRRQDAHEFDLEAQDLLRGLPEYYQRNFHFQSDGYMTKNSANLYEHQVEILFSGSADAMRRLILPQLKEAFAKSATGEGLHFLEVAAGTGRLTRFVKLAFPKARVTVLDLSFPYLKKAQENLKDFDRIDFVQGAGEELPFTDQKFDAVFSCFLFHELPMEIRKKVVAESFRVLKPEGWVGLIDSVQNEDAPDLKWALDRFPTDFHEPFYMNYLQNPMEGLLVYRGFSDLKKDRGFFSKSLLAKKPIST